MAFYLANDEDLTSVANALRAKTGLSKQLVFPGEFVSTINSITGDGIEISIDSIPTENSNNAVSSGGVYSALALKQNSLTFDAAPTQNSSNPVTSHGIYTALNNLNIPAAQVQADWNQTNSSAIDYIKNKPIIYDYIANSSTNLVSAAAIYNALQAKQDTITFDIIPTSNSTNPVTSDGIYTALQAKQNNLTAVPLTTTIYSTDYLFIERNGVIYKVLVSALSIEDDPSESDPNALTTDSGDSIFTEDGNELIIDAGSDIQPINSEALSLENGEQLLTEDNQELLINERIL